MKVFRLSALAVSLVAATFAANAQEPAASPASNPPLKLVGTIELPASATGKFDHLAVDLVHNRLFASPESSGSIVVMDLKTQKFVRQVDGIKKPHAILYRPDLNRIYVTDGVDGSVRVLDGDTYEIVKTVPLLKDSDSIGYDPFTKYLYVDNGGGDEGKTYSMLSVVDTTAGKKVADISIDGKTLEAMALEKRTEKMYVNDIAKSQVIEVDRFANKIMNTWPITLCAQNVSMAMDEYRQRLFVGCRTGKVVVLDTSTGKELQTFPIKAGVDDMVYDGDTRRLYSAGDGAISVYEEIDANQYHYLGDVPSAPLGKTALLVPSLNRYFVAVPAHDGKNASILVYEPVFYPTNMPIAESIPWKPAYTVHAPAAEHIILSTLSAHPVLRTLGIHAIAPGETQSVILANANQGILGKPTSDRDITNLGNGKTFIYKDNDGLDYDIWMQLRDAKGDPIGLLVTEIPYTGATDVQDATRQAEAVRDEVAARIPNLESLFAN